MAEKSDIKDGETVRMATDKGNSIEVKLSLIQNYTATITKLSGNEESDDNTFKVTFKRCSGDVAPMDVGAVGSSRNQKRGDCVFVLKCKAGKIPEHCLRNNTPLFRGTNYKCKEKCGATFCLNCALGKGNIQQCPKCKLPIKIEKARISDPEKVYDN